MEDGKSQFCEWARNDGVSRQGAENCDCRCGRTIEAKPLSGQTGRSSPRMGRQKTIRERALAKPAPAPKRHGAAAAPDMLTAERRPRRTIPLTRLHCSFLADRYSGVASDTVEQQHRRPVLRRHGYPIDLVRRRSKRKLGKAMDDAIEFRWRLAIALSGRNAVDA
jgi:hypothetical protein